MTTNARKHAGDRLCGPTGHTLLLIVGLFLSAFLSNFTVLLPLWVVLGIGYPRRTGRHRDREAHPSSAAISANSKDVWIFLQVACPASPIRFRGACGGRKTRSISSGTVSVS